MTMSDASRIRKQKLLILLCFLVYSFAYTGRYSYSANLAPIIDHYGVNRETAGLVNTFFFISYGVGQLLNAFLCKIYPKRYVITGALWISALINLFLFFLPSFGYIKYLWMLNGICQSVLWPCLILIIGETIEPCLTKQAMFITSIAGVSGTLIAYGGSSLLNLISFRYSFLMGVALPAVIGLVWFFSYNTLTEEKYVSEVKSVAEEEQTSNRRGSVASAIVGLLAVCAVFAAIVNLVKDGLNTWITVILKEQFAFDDSISIVLSLVLPLCGVFGSVIAMQGNKLIKEFRSLIGVMYLILSALLLGVVWGLKIDSALLTILFFGVVSCMTNAINTVLLSIMPLALRDRVNTGFLAGFMNACCYAGSAVSAYGLGKIADGKSWIFVICVLLVISVVATVLAGMSILLKNTRENKSLHGGN